MNTLDGWLQTTTEYHPIITTKDIPKEKHQWPIKLIPFPWGQTPQFVCYSHDQSSQPSSLSSVHWHAKSNQGLTPIREHLLPTQGAPLEHPAQMNRDTAPSDAMGHLLHKATLPSLGDVLDLSNTYKHREKVKKRGQKNTSQMKEQRGGRKKKL